MRQQRVLRETDGQKLRMIKGKLLPIGETNGQGLKRFSMGPEANLSDVHGFTISK